MLLTIFFISLITTWQNSSYSRESWKFEKKKRKKLYIIIYKLYFQRTHHILLNYICIITKYKHCHNIIWLSKLSLHVLILKVTVCRIKYNMNHLLHYLVFVFLLYLLSYILCTILFVLSCFDIVSSCLIIAWIIVNDLSMYGTHKLLFCGY